MYFGDGVDRDIDAMRERLEMQRCAPGVVEEREHPGGAGGGGDGRHVLHLEGQGTRALQEHDPGLGPDAVGDGGPDERVVVFGLDAKAPQGSVAERAGGAVDAIHHQQMVAGPEPAEQRAADRGQPRGCEPGAVSAFERCDRLLQREGAGGAVHAIGDGIAGGQGVGVPERGQIGVEDGRGPIDGRVDGADMVGGPAAEMSRAGGVLHVGSPDGRVSRGSAIRGLAIRLPLG